MKNNSLKLIIFGNKISTKYLLEHLILNNVNINTLVTLDENLSKKYEISGGDGSLSEYGKLVGINLFNPISYDMSSQRDIDFFIREKFDIGISTGWQRLIPNDILNNINYGVFGWHGSMFQLPNGRGRSPMNWSIRLGGSVIFHNLFKYAKGADTGEIFETQVIPIHPEDYIGDLSRKAQLHIMESSLRLLDQANNGRIHLNSQLNQSHILFPKLTENDGHIVTSMMTKGMARNIIRSCSKPFPGAFISSNNVKLVRLWDAEEVSGNNFYLEHGEMLLNDQHCIISCLDGILRSNKFDILGDICKNKKILID